MHNNENRQGLDKYVDEGKKKDIKYVSLLFLAFFPLKKSSKCPTDIDNRTRSLNYIVYISKIG